MLKMNRSRDLRRLFLRTVLIASLAMALVGVRWRSGRTSTGAAPPAGARPGVAAMPDHGPPPLAPDAGAARENTVAAADPPPAERNDAAQVAPRAGTAALLAEAGAARRRGDLRSTLALLRRAVAGEPGGETHAALGGLYLELGAAGAAEPNLRAAAEADPGNADRWIALANALALKPDPMAAAGALDRARAADPGLRVTRDAGGLLVRATAP